MRWVQSKLIEYKIPVGRTMITLDVFGFADGGGVIYVGTDSACSVGWFVSLLVREEVLLASLCERKILFGRKIYDRLRQATAKRTG